MRQRDPAALKRMDFRAVKAWIDATNSEVEEFAQRRMDKHIARAIAGHSVAEFSDPPRSRPGIGADEDEDEDER